MEIRRVHAKNKEEEAELIEEAMSDEDCFPIKTVVSKGKLEVTFLKPGLMKTEDIAKLCQEMFDLGKKVGVSAQIKSKLGDDTNDLKKLMHQHIIGEMLRNIGFVLCIIAIGVLIVKVLVR